MTPATAVEPTKAIAVTVIPEIIAGIASGKSTFLTTVQVVAPIDQAASITLLSICLKAISTNLALKGAALIINAGKAPVGPLIVTNSNLLNGINNKINIYIYIA